MDYLLFTSGVSGHYQPHQMLSVDNVLHPWALLDSGAGTNNVAFVTFYEVIMKLYRTGKVAEIFGVNKVTVIRWIKRGRIKAVRVGKEFRIPEDEVKRLLKGKITNAAVIYARVSSSDQKRDLERQVEYLKESTKGYNVVDVLTDIASGLNEKRRGLKKLFDYVVNGKVDVVVISYKDRLTRFGFRYLEEFFNSHGVRIEAVFGKEPNDLQQELIEDLIAFTGRLCGMRSHKKKKVVESVKQAIRDC